MNVEKQAIRRELRHRRKALPARVVEAAGAAVYGQLRILPAYAEAVSVVAYIAAENEIPTSELIAAVARSGRTLLLPRCDDPPALVRWEPGDPLVAGYTGIPEPLVASPAVLQTPAVALLPVVAWDLRGSRLGRGGGFYDRLLARLDGDIVRIGLAYEFQHVPEIPREAWDISLDYVITERRTIRCGASTAGERAFQKGGLRQ